MPHASCQTHRLRQTVEAVEECTCRDPQLHWSQSGSDRIVSQVICCPLSSPWAYMVLSLRSIQHRRTGVSIRRETTTLFHGERYRRGREAKSYLVESGGTVDVPSNQNADIAKQGHGLHLQADRGESSNVFQPQALTDSQVVRVQYQETRER